ncbi:(2Fe-2S)-binding protein [Pendulispora brunnea]|uniref:(2Fe-2S)-binding protein n=1 Tax=Pendulispora brunnea TaxID=2905690 RepID=A0ABZ2K8N9_9BACT
MHAKVRIAASDVAFDAPEGSSLLQVLQSNGYPIATSCGGVASCGLCRLTVVRGGDSLSPLRPQELVHLGNVAKVVGLRLACQSKVTGPGPIVVQVPEVEIVEERKRRKAERLRAEDHGLGLPPSSRRTRESPSHPSPTSTSSGSNERRGERVEWRPRVLDKRNGG